MRMIVRMIMRMIVMAKIPANSHPPHEFQWKDRLLSLLSSFSFPLTAPHKSWQRCKNLILQFTITYFTCIARPCFLHCSWSCGRALAEISKKRKICTMARLLLITLRKKDLWLFSGSIRQRLLGNWVFRLADKYLQPGSFNWLNFKKSKIKIDNSVLYNLILL